LQTIEHSGVEIELCARCGGLWLDGGELQEVMQHYDSSITPETFSRGLGDSKGPGHKLCPEGHGHLEEYLWGRSIAIEIDRCVKCKGIWLDRGELDHLQVGDDLAEARALIEREKTLLTWLFQFVTQLPVEFNFKPRRPPMLTYSLIALNVAIFLGQIGGNTDLAIDEFALHPDRAFSASYWVGFFAHNFLHGNLIHLAGNMYFLWMLGDNLEDLLGRTKLLLFCLGAAVTAGMAETLLTHRPEIPIVGFSGIISGMLLTYALLFRNAKLSFMLVLFQLKLPATLWVAIWLGLNLAGYVLEAGLVSWQGHLGGAAFGIVFGLLAYRPLMRRDPLLRLLNG